MPFCRKCGRRLPQYSLSCSECKTSTTAPLIKIKKTQESSYTIKSANPVPAKLIITTKDSPTKKTVISSKPTKTSQVANAFESAKGSEDILQAENITPKKPIILTKPVTPKIPPHEIKQSKTSIEEDIITNPHDYETQAFEFNLKCPNGHFWRAGKALPISNGKAYCPKCGEQLRKPNPKNKKRYRTVGS